MDGDAERDRILTTLWETIGSLDVENVRSYPAAIRAIDSGARPEDLVTAMSVSAYEAVFAVLSVLTGEEDLEALVESGAIAMLHGDLLGADPTRRKGSDLFD